MKSRILQISEAGARSGPEDWDFCSPEGPSVRLKIYHLQIGYLSGTPKMLSIRQAASLFQFCTSYVVIIWIFFRSKCAFIS